MSFAFDKLYADLVTSDGTVCVAYLAWLDAWGMRKAYAGLELYWPNGQREVIQARPPTERIDPGHGEPEDAFRLSFDVPGGPFVMDYRVRHGAWLPSGDPPCKGLRWSVKAARADVVARWSGDPSRPVLEGVGYSDTVEIGRPLRSLALGRLRWGRLHLPEATVVFDTLDFEDGRSWRRAARWTACRVTEHRKFELPVGLEVARELHAGDAIDEARFPRVVDRMMSRAITGRAVERRLLSRLQPGGWALHEVVCFGRDSGPEVEDARSTGLTP
jgi:hypothetical protein